MLPSERLKPQSECQSQAQSRSTGRFSNVSQSSSIFTYSISPFLANSGLYTTPSLPLLVTLLFTGKLTGTCGFCLDGKAARPAVIHLLLDAWTVGLAEEGFFRPLEAWSTRKNTAYPWETWQQLPVISGGNDQSESIHLTGKGQEKKKQTASLPKW